MMRRKLARVVVRVRFGRQFLGPAGGKLGFRLGDVGARHLADVEAVLGLLQRLLEHANVAALDFDDRGVAQIIHVNRRRRQQHRLLQHAKAFTCRGHLALRRAGLVGGPLAVEKRLRDGGLRRTRRD